MWDEVSPVELGHITLWHRNVDKRFHWGPRMVVVHETTGHVVGLSPHPVPGAGWSQWPTARVL